MGSIPKARYRADVHDLHLTELTGISPFEHAKSTDVKCTTKCYDVIDFLHSQTAGISHAEIHLLITGNSR